MEKNNFFRIYFYECPKVLYHWLKALPRLVLGAGKVLQLAEPRITIFGGSKVTTDPYVREAHLLAKKLAEHDITILTGGGPGIMEAANCGAAEVAKIKNKKMSIGVSLRNGFLNEKMNLCAQEHILVEHLFERKYLLTKFSSAFIVFPGGYGTLDELSEILTLMEVKRMPCLPVILFGREFWQPCVNWVDEYISKKSLIPMRAIELITITDDIEEVFTLIHKSCTYYTEPPKTP